MTVVFLRKRMRGGGGGGGGGGGLDGSKLLPQEGKTHNFLIFLSSPTYFKHFKKSQKTMETLFMLL